MLSRSQQLTGNNIGDNVYDVRSMWSFWPSILPRLVQKACVMQMFSLHNSKLHSFRATVYNRCTLKDSGLSSQSLILILHTWTFTHVRFFIFRFAPAIPVSLWAVIFAIALFVSRNDGVPVVACKLLCKTQHNKHSYTLFGQQTTRANQTLFINFSLQLVSTGLIGTLNQMDQFENEHIE